MLARGGFVGEVRGTRGSSFSARQKAIHELDESHEMDKTLAPKNKKAEGFNLLPKMQH